MGEGGFDLAAYRRESMGGDPDRGLLVTFRYEPQQKDDGSFENVEYVNIWLSNSDQVDRPVTQQDRARFRTRYEAFLKNEELPDDGTPIKMCSLATPAIVAACKSERITTLEQLVEIPDERLQRAKLVAFKYRAKDWLLALKDHGHVAKMRSEIETLKAQIETLKSRNVDKREPKRRGRPPKVVEDDASDAA